LGHDPLGAIWRPQGNLVSGPEAQAEEPCRDGIRFLEELRIRQATPEARLGGNNNGSPRGVRGGDNIESCADAEAVERLGGNSTRVRKCCEASALQGRRRSNCNCAGRLGDWKHSDIVKEERLKRLST